MLGPVYVAVTLASTLLLSGFSSAELTSIGGKVCYALPIGRNFTSTENVDFLFRYTAPPGAEAVEQLRCNSTDVDAEQGYQATELVKYLAVLYQPAFVFRYRPDTKPTLCQQNEVVVYRNATSEHRWQIAPVCK